MPSPSSTRLAAVVVLATLPWTISLVAAPAPDWRPIALRSAGMKAAGLPGGEGAQVPRAIAIAPGDPSFMLWGTDVGGLFRSLDGGRTWEPANIGYFSRGSTALAVDPHYPARVISLGTNSVPGEHNGLYLSENRAASWREVFRSPTPMANNRDERRQIVFDPATRDTVRGRTLVAYWARAEFESAIWRRPDPYPMLYTTHDGGETWREVPEGRAIAGAWLAMHPGGGTLYAAHRTGLFASSDGGLSFEKLLDGPVHSVDTSPASPDSLWVALDRSLQRSDDRGRTWTQLPGSDVFRGGDHIFRGLTVSPSHPSRLVVWQSTATNRYWGPRFASHDGGITWRESRVDAGLNLLPRNLRRGHFAFHPRNPDIILSSGGDFPTLSTDGGLSYVWSASGVNNILVGGGFNFSVADPDVVFFGSQDYGALLTTDGGDTWRYFAPGGREWGGFNYAGYATSPRVLVVGEAEGWNKPRFLTHSSDGGARWTVTKLEAGPSTLVGYGDPRRPGTLFWAHYRSTDEGRTWAPMSGVSVVNTHDAADGSLWGINRSDPASQHVVRSTDGGSSWHPVGSPGERITDVAAHEGAAFAAMGGHLVRLEGARWGRIDGLPRAFNGRVPGARSVAIDPVVPRIVYAALGQNDMIPDIGPLRSTDGGRTWHSLRRSTPLEPGGARDGAAVPDWVRVNPRTREAWWATSCMGLWKLPPPLD